MQLAGGGDAERDLKRKKNEGREKKRERDTGCRQRHTLYYLLVIYIFSNRYKLLIKCVLHVLFDIILSKIPNKISYPNSYIILISVLFFNKSML